ncbi:MAG: 30S ribosomal protein S6 [Chloroflexi bacterium]|nr:30S ribosomal protein S6 [Chloroflexota bacterium]MDA8188687.1 30S ribosomal protein S6 [Dehalococcoidales bacterium]
MRDYELVVIINPQVGDEDVDGVVQKVSQLITSNGGEITEVNPWGRRRLAYPINSFREGYYVVTKLRMRPAATAEVERSLKLTEEIIRYLLVKIGE